MKKCFLLLALFVCNKIFTQNIYTWNKTGTADWTVDINWTPARTTPSTNDVLVFDNGATSTITNIPAQTIGQLLVNNNTTANLQAGTSGAVLNIAGGAGDDLAIATGASLNINGSNAATVFISTGATAVIYGNVTFSAAAHKFDAADASGIFFNSPAIFTQTTGCSGNVFTTAGTHNAVVFNNGTTFIQKAGANPFGLSQPASKVVFNTGSLFKVQQVLFPAVSGRTYANLEIDWASFNNAVTGVNALTVDDLTITQGALSLNLTGGVNIKGNIIVAAGQSLSFNPASTSNVSFDGSTAQNITNDGTLTFNSNEAVVFNNPSGITLNNDITFNSLVTFTSGIITVPDPAIITFSATASVAGVSNTSFVDGKIKKIGNTTFTFPVGKNEGIFSGYVPIKISAPATITDAFVAAYKRANAVAISNNYAGILHHVSGVDYWTLDRANGTSTVDVTLYWTIQSSSNGTGHYINDIGKLVIAHYNGSTQWDTYGGTSNSGSGFASGSITWPAVNTFSPASNIFSLGSTDPSNPLPVSINYLNGFQQSDVNILHWKVYCTNTTGIDIVVERSSDAIHFVPIHAINATALQCLQPFDHIDAHPLGGINYYRLQLIDNGQRIYSNIISIKNKSKVITISLTPTIVNDRAVLHITSPYKTNTTVVISDASGRMINKSTCEISAGNYQLPLNVDGLAAGVYQVTVYLGLDKVQSLKFIKQ